MDSVTPPPVQLPPIQRESWLAPWGMVAFGCVIFALMVLQLTAYLAGGDSEEKSIGAEVDLSLKMYMVSEALQSQVKSVPGDSDAETKKASVKQLETIETEVKKDGVKGEEESRVLVLLQKAQDKKLDEEAVKTLEESKVPLDANVLRAAKGDATVASKFEGQGTPVERLAKALALESGGDKMARGKMMSMAEAVGVLLPIFMFIMLIGAGVIVWVGYFVYHGTGGLKPPTGWPKLWSADAAEANMLRAGAFLFLYFVVAQGVLALALKSLFEAMGQKADFAVIGILGQVLGVAFLFLLAAFPVGGQRVDLVKMIRGEGGIGGHLMTGFLAYLANFPAFTLAALVGTMLLGKVLPTPSHSVSEELMGSPSIMTIVILGILASVFAPFIEEIVFRGWFFGGMMRRTRNLWLSIALAGISFAVIHPQGPILYGSLACIGAMGAFVTYRSGSLIPAMVMHCLHNFTILLIGSSMLG